jgi:SAM-dependent methyltransferase
MSDPDYNQLYRHSAEWFDIRYAQKDYGRDAKIFADVIARLNPNAKTLLDVACGTGRHLEHLEGTYRSEALDLSAELLRIAKSRLRDVPLHQLDMSNFNLNRTFDVVACFFASIPYLRNFDKLQQAVSCMAQHLSPSGILFIEPWLTPSKYRENEVVHNFRREKGNAFSWMYVQRRVGQVAVWDINWLIGTPGGGVTHFVEREELALFTTEEIASALRQVGLDVVYHPRGLHGYGGFFGRKEPWSPAETLIIDEVLST